MRSQGAARRERPPCLAWPRSHHLAAAPLLRWGLLGRGGQPEEWGVPTGHREKHRVLLRVGKGQVSRARREVLRRVSLQLCSRALALQVSQRVAGLLFAKLVLRGRLIEGAAIWALGVQVLGVGGAIVLGPLCLWPLWVLGRGGQKGRVRASSTAPPQSTQGPRLWGPQNPFPFSTPGPHGFRGHPSCACLWAQQGLGNFPSTLGQEIRTSSAP